MVCVQMLVLLTANCSVNSPTGNLLWKVEQKTMVAFACAKVLAKGKRHWYKAVEQTAFVALSDDSAWIIRTNGDLYLQTGTVNTSCEFHWIHVVLIQISKQPGIVFTWTCYMLKSQSFHYGPGYTI